MLGGVQGGRRDGGEPCPDSVQLVCTAHRDRAEATALGRQGAPALPRPPASHGSQPQPILPDSGHTCSAHRMGRTSQEPRLHRPPAPSGWPLKGERGSRHGGGTAGPSPLTTAAHAPTGTASSAGRDPVLRVSVSRQTLADIHGREPRLSGQTLAA